MLTTINNKLLSLEAQLKVYEKEIEDLKTQLKTYQSSTLIKLEKGAYFKFEMDRIKLAFANYSYKHFLKREDYVYKTISHEVKRLEKLSYVYDPNTRTFLLIDEDGNGTSDADNTVINTALDLIRTKVVQHTATFYKSAEDDPITFQKNKSKIDTWKNCVCEVRGSQRDKVVSTIANSLKKICVAKVVVPMIPTGDDGDWGIEYD